MAKSATIIARNNKMMYLRNLCGGCACFKPKLHAVFCRGLKAVGAMTTDYSRSLGILCDLCAWGSRTGRFVSRFQAQAPKNSRCRVRAVLVMSTLQGRGDLARPSATSGPKCQDPSSHFYVTGNSTSTFFVEFSMSIVPCASRPPPYSRPC